MRQFGRLQTKNFGLFMMDGGGIHWVLRMIGLEEELMTLLLIQRVAYIWPRKY